MAIFRAPTDKNYDVLLAENGFITDIQLAIETVMSVKGISQAELAKRMGISDARVSQILSDNGANLEARTIARIGHALGMRTVVGFLNKFSQRDVRDFGSSLRVSANFKDWVKAKSQPPGHVWECLMPSNDDCIADAA
jgi:transcriptional regulator with XRE-family HTH domain